jgi:protein-export membrane protein SecD
MRLGLIVFGFGFCAFLLWPSYVYFGRYSKFTPDQIAKLPEDQRKQYFDVAGKSIKLGLDLRGGMPLVLELDESKGRIQNKTDAQDRVLQILHTRVDKFGVTEPTISKQGDSRIMIQLPGIDDPQRALDLIQTTAQLEFRMVRDMEETRRIVLEIDKVLHEAAVTDSLAKAAQPASKPAEMAAAKSAADTTKHAVADSAFKEFAQPKAVTVPTSSQNPFTSQFITFRFGALYVPDDGARVQRVREMLARPEVQRLIPADAEFLWSSEEERTADGVPTKLLYMINKRVEVRGDRLETAGVSPDAERPGGMKIDFRLDRRGARQFAKLTEANVGKQLAIILDNVVKSAPNIKSKIPNGEGMISGSYSDAQARDLSIVLRAGALPVSLKFIEERTVGPTLGSDSLHRGMMASLVGLGLSVLFMIIYYRLSGVLAAAALALNMVIVLAAMAAFGAAMSLPGIAGLVLSVAMAVDANVLIFERIREELRKNKTVASSIDAGYRNAFSAIIDSNMTTVFAGIVLLYFGTGPVKGFAVTLCIGITASMFTALFVTRFVYDFITRRRKLTSLSI